MNQVNDDLILVVGASATGKSYCLHQLKEPEGVLYLGSEAGKKLPFKSHFIEKIITDPLQVFQAFEWAESNDVHTIVIDSLTFLMDMYESQYVLTATNGMKAWGDYAQFFKKLLQEYTAASTKNVIYTAHTANIFNETDMVQEVRVKIKGSIMNNGVESYFSNVIATKKLPLTKLEGYASEYLNITEDEEMLGFKHIFQTRLTKETVNEAIRSPVSMWKREETYIDNNIQYVLDRLHQFYT